MTEKAKETRQVWSGTGLMIRYRRFTSDWISASELSKNLRTDCSRKSLKVRFQSDMMLNHFTSDRIRALESGFRSETR